ncbi:UNVERIFIED_CONTAM: hypothetical protein FKN15_024167 [Acipenser sinensis]
MESGAELKVLSDPSGTSPSDSLPASNSEQDNEKPSEEPKDNPRKKRKLSSDRSVISLNENTALQHGLSSEAQGKGDAVTDPGVANNELSQPTQITGSDNETGHTDSKENQGVKSSENSKPKHEKNQNNASNLKLANKDQNSNVTGKGNPPEISSNTGELQSPLKKKKPTPESGSQDQLKKNDTDTNGQNENVKNMEEEPTANSTCAQEQPDDKTPPSKSQDPTEGQQDDDGFELVTNKRHKNKNKQQPDKPPVQRIPEPQQVPVGARLTIYFHAIVSKDFKLDPNKDKVFLRAGDPIGSWNTNSVEMFISRDLGIHGFLVEGQLTTSKQKACAVSIPYKYVVCREKTAALEYEYIYKFDSAEVVNRCLFIKNQLLSEGGEWHQYDDIICVKPSKGLLNRVKDMFWRKDENEKTVKGRNIAGKIMLETIFGLLKSWSEVNLKSFFIQLNQFFMTYKEPFVYEDKEEKWYSLGYGEKEVKSLLKEFMIEKVAPRLQKDADTGDVFIKDRLKAGMIMLLIWSKYSIILTAEDTSKLCDLLVLPQKPKDELILYCKDFMTSFTGEKTLVESLTMFCRSAIRTRIVKWVLLIPLVHILKGVCKPFESTPFKANTTSEVSWAGLEGLVEDFSRSRKSLEAEDKRALMKIVSAKKHLVEIDKMLARSWLYCLDLEDVTEYITAVHVDLLDILQGFLYKLSGETTYSHYEKVLNLLSHIINNLNEQQYSWSEGGYQEACLKTATNLLERICRATKEQRFYLVPVTCINLVVMISEMERLPPQMWSSLLTLSFGDAEFTSNWKKVLLNDLEGKLKQEKAMDQIEIYCSKSEEMSQSYPLVSRCFENCALEAVNSICQEKSETKLFDMIEKLNFRRIGNLVSTIIVKSWPRDREGSYLDGYDVVVEHLLSWSAAKNVFQLQGGDGKITDKLTDQAKELIAIASCAFIDIANQFLAGDIRIKHLQKILQKKKDFLVLLKIKGLTDNERCKDVSAMKTVLQWREEEVQAILHEKELVHSLLTMCRKITEFVNVDIEDLERRDCCNIELKKLEEVVVVHQLDKISPEDAGKVLYFQLNEDMREMAEHIHTFKDSYIFQICWENEAKSQAVTDPNTEELTPDPDIELTVDTISEEIFEPCFKRYTSIYEDTKEGSLTLGEVDTIFEAYKSKDKDLRQDLVIMSKLQHSDDKRWIGRRIQQIQQYHELYLAVESAQVIMEVKETLGLNGDFTVLETLLDVTHEDFKREKLNRIDNDLIQAKTILVDITETRRRCLVELRQRKNFVNWVKEALEDGKFHTKALSPFDDSVDRTPVVRSVVLKLLLKYSFERVKNYLQQHLSSVERSLLLGDEDKTELYALFINCLEDSMYENAQCFTVSEQQSLLEQESHFLRHAIGNKGSSVSVEYLQAIARIRLSLDMAANFLVEPGNSGSQLQIPGGQHMSEFLKSVKQLCEGSGNDWYRIYLARKICRQQGMEFVQQLLNNMHYRWIFPVEIVQQQAPTPPLSYPLLPLRICGNTTNIISYNQRHYLPQELTSRN